MLKNPASEMEMRLHEEANSRTLIKSRFDFLKGHNGLRPNTLHGLMAPTHSGKSTLIKSIIAETALQAKCLVWLSEETVKEYQSLLNKLDYECLKNIVFVEERELPKECKEDQTAFLNKFIEMANESEAEFVFVDNVSTSMLYNDHFGFKGQSRTTSFLMRFVKEICSVVYLTHTEAKITENYNQIVIPENIRGPKVLALSTEYFYIIQKFTSNNLIYNLLRVAKHRHHEKAGGWFALEFIQGTYVGDAEIPFSLVNEIFQKRDYLGKKQKKNIKHNPPRNPEDIPMKEESML